MLPVLVAGAVFGLGAAVGQKYGEEVIIPAAEKAFGELRTEWNAFSDACKTEWDAAAEEAKKDVKS